jgi:hypothetical protein
MNGEDRVRMLQGGMHRVAAEVVELGTFARQWGVEGRRLAWLVGAGGSAAARVPTAAHIVSRACTQMPMGWYSRT